MTRRAIDPDPAATARDEAVDGMRLRAGYNITLRTKAAQQAAEWLSRIEGEHDATRDRMRPNEPA